MYVCMYVGIGVFLCMYVCMYVCIHVCMHVCMHICMYLCMHAWMYVCMYVWMYMYICMYACINEYIYVSMYVCRYVGGCPCMYACIYVCVYVSVLIQLCYTMKGTIYKWIKQKNSHRNQILHLFIVYLQEAPPAVSLQPSPTHSAVLFHHTINRHVTITAVIVGRQSDHGRRSHALCVMIILSEWRDTFIFS